jgi:hypothetical protein
MAPYEQTTKRIKIEKTTPVPVVQVCDDTFVLQNILSYVGDHQYRFIASAIPIRHYIQRKQRITMHRR